MKIIRSIIAIIAGLIVGMVVISVIEAGSHAVYPQPADFGKMMMDPDVSRQKKYEVIQSLPVGALASVLFGWMCGAFVGGGVAGAIASCCRALHASVIGVVILLASIMMMVMIPHPDWMLIGGLAAPLPLSVCAGVLSAKLFSPKEAAST